AVRGRPVRGDGDRDRDRALGRQDRVPRGGGAGRDFFGARRFAAGPGTAARHRLPDDPVSVRTEGDLGPGDARGIPRGGAGAGFVRADLHGAPAAGRGRARDRNRGLSMHRFALVALFIACGADAAEFRSVQDNAAVLYDAPSRAATPLYVVSRNYPLEVIVNLEAWVKVRDHAGALTWIEKKSLGEKRMVLVTAPTADARQRPEDGAPPAFSAAQNVALELLEVSPNGWLRVRHWDG